MNEDTIVDVCLSKPYPIALERCGISYTTYLAVRRDHKFPPRSGMRSRNMELRKEVIRVVTEHPQYDYHDVAAVLNVALPRVWKVFTDYMLHEIDVRMHISRCQISLM